MAQITELMKELDYPTNPLGVCSGLAYMAEKARDCGEIDEFVARINLLNELENNVIKGMINDVKIKQKSKVSLTSREKILLTVEAFFFQVCSYKEPDAIREFLEIEKKEFLLDQFLEFEKMCCSAEDDKPSLLNIPGCFDFKIHEKNLEDSLFLFLDIIGKADFSLGLIIAHNGHSVHLFYDNKNKYWALTDYTDFSTIISLKEMVQELINSFTIDDSLDWIFFIFTREIQKRGNLLRTLNGALSSLIPAAPEKINFENKGVTGGIAGFLIGAGGAILINSFFGGVSSLEWTLIGGVTGVWLEKTYGFLKGFSQRGTKKTEKILIEENIISPQKNPYLSEFLSSQLDTINSFPLGETRKPTFSGTKYGETTEDYDHNNLNVEDSFKLVPNL